MTKPFANSQFFEKNVATLFEVDEPLSNAMRQIKAINAPLRFVKTSDDNLYDSLRKISMYENVAAEFNEKKAYFDENFPKHPVLFLFGFGNGALIEYLLKNSRHTNIIVFECELEPIFHTLQRFDCSQDIKKERLIPFYVPNLNPAQLGTLFSYKSISESVKTYNFTSVANFYDKFYAEQMNEINLKLIENVRFAFIRKGNDPKDSLNGVERILYNVPKMLARPSLQTLLNTRKNASKNAIVVSTGPSLTKQLPLLKKVQEYATILCADSAYAILHKNGIVPDYVLSIERVRATSELFNNDFGEFDKDIIFLLAAVTDFKTTEYLEKNNRKYMIALRPGLFPKYLKLDEFGYIGVNHSVSNMSFELAAYLKHENIALIGQDLAYDDSGKSHPDEYMYVEEVDVKNTALLEATAYGGKGVVKTNAVWELFKQGFENDIVMAQVRYKATAYNCTEGGARIEGAIEMPFTEFCEKFLKEKLKKPFAKAPCLDTKEQNELLKKTKKRLMDSSKKSELYLEEVKKELENLKELLPNDYEFEKLNFKALNKSKQKLKNLHARFEKSIIFTEITDVLYYQNNCEIVKLECINAKDEKEEKRLLVRWLSTMANWFIEVGEYIYTQDERIRRYIKEW